MSPSCGKSEDDDPEGLSEEGPEGLTNDHISGYIKKTMIPF